MVRPCFDYAAVVYHSLLSKTQSDAFERLQRKIVKIIYGFEESYDRCLGRAGLDYLSVRRSKMCEKFALKAQRSEKFSSWFPKTIVTPYLNQKPYKEFPARTERLRAAPIYMFRRILNAQE